MKLSIVIPAYNIKDYIGKCLDSVLAQTFTDYEIIVINDGSTDGTDQVLNEYARKDSRILVVHKENGGVSKARNIGIELARGEYFLFFDGDDFMEPYTLEELYENATRTGADTVIYGYYRYENGAVKETCLPNFTRDWYEGDEVIEEVMPRFIGLSNDRINDWLNHKEGALKVENPALWRSMTSTKVIKENHLQFRPELSVGEDTLFISEYLTHAKKVSVVQKCYYYLVTRETSAIYVYEKAPLKKLDQKIKQLEARMELTKDVAERRQKDISNTWKGTIVMSSVEMAFLLSHKIPDKSKKERYQLYLSYAKLPEVEKCVKEYDIQCKLQVKKIPFIFLKKKWYRLLFFACGMLHLIGYQFSRS